MESSQKLVVDKEKLNVESQWQSKFLKLETMYKQLENESQFKEEEFQKNIDLMKMATSTQIMKKSEEMKLEKDNIEMSNLNLMNQIDDLESKLVNAENEWRNSSLNMQQSHHETVFFFLF